MVTIKKRIQVNDRKRGERMCSYKLTPDADLNQKQKLEQKSVAPKQRNTKQRSLVLDVVRSHRDHPTADQIYQDVHERNDKVSRATVYRNLNLLDELGQIQQVAAPTANRFDLRVDPHYHLMCIRCGSVVDAPLEYQQTYDGFVAESSGFKLVDHQTLFKGICPECQKKAAGQDSLSDERGEQQE